MDVHLFTCSIGYSLAGLVIKYIGYHWLIKCQCQKAVRTTLANVALVDNTFTLHGCLQEAGEGKDLRVICQYFDLNHFL